MADLTELSKRASLNVRAILRVKYWFDWIEEHVGRNTNHTEVENELATIYADRKVREHFESIESILLENQKYFLIFVSGNREEISEEIYSHNYKDYTLNKL